MAKMEQAIRDEILRLARKEIRAICVPLTRDVRELRRPVSGMSKTGATLERQVKELQAKKLAEASKLEVPAKEVKASRFSPGLIKSLRKRLGISQSQLAALIGVSLPAVGFWEQGRTRPDDANKAAIVALRKLSKREVKEILAETQVGQEPKKVRKKTTKKAGKKTKKSRGTKKVKRAKGRKA